MKIIEPRVTERPKLSLKLISIHWMGSLDIKGQPSRGEIKNIPGSLQYSWRHASALKFNHGQIGLS